MRLECDWLEAIYPQAAAGRPDKITAQGLGRDRAGHERGALQRGAHRQRRLHRRVQERRARRRRSAAEPTTSRPNTIYFDLCKGTVRAVGDVLIRVREQPGRASRSARRHRRPGRNQAPPRRTANESRRPCTRVTCARSSARRRPCATCAGRRPRRGRRSARSERGGQDHHVQHDRRAGCGRRPAGSSSVRRRSPICRCTSGRGRGSPTCRRSPRSSAS